MATATITCWEPTELGTPVLAAAQKLYEQTIEADERIPWMWIERAVAEIGLRRPTGWVKRLLLAFDGPNVEDPTSLVGYSYGAFIPGYGGYVCYVGVSENARSRGVGKRLFEAMFEAFAKDAAIAGESLPFTIWESYRPTAEDSREAQGIWQARMRLFERVGGLWVDGVELLSPDYSEENPSSGVPLQLFLKPMAEPRESFTSARIRTAIGGLLEKVYHEKPGDYYYDGTLSNGSRAALVSPDLAAAVAV